MISVVIPALNEELHVADVIAGVRQAGECEIIVVDGGSTDGTLAQASGADRVIMSAPGRARQMNTGAKSATGEILLFLHADCRLPVGFADAVAQALKSPDVIGGCFLQRIDSPRRIYRWIEWGNALRVRRLGWIYGDQALFVRRSVFDDLGGFPELPIMEDLYFAKRLRGRGRLTLIADRLVVDARRWEHDGAVRRTLWNWAFILLAGCGVPLSRIARWYGHVRRSSGGNPAANECDRQVEQA